MGRLPVSTSHCRLLPPADIQPPGTPCRHGRGGSAGWGSAAPVAVRGALPLPSRASDPIGRVKPTVGSHSDRSRDLLYFFCNRVSTGEMAATCDPIQTEKKRRANCGATVPVVSAPTGAEPISLTLPVSSWLGSWQIIPPCPTSSRIIQQHQ